MILYDIVWRSAVNVYHVLSLQSLHGDKTPNKLLIKCLSNKKEEITATERKEKYVVKKF